MRSTFCTSLAVLLMCTAASADSIQGQYVEARNAAMWAGPCLTNSEMGIVGDKATLAWKVTRGTVDDVSLEGLSIVAMVFGDGTFGMGRVNTQTILIVDQKATEAQQAALIKMARSLAGETIQRVIEVRRAKIEMEVDEGSCYSLVDAQLAKVRTRRLRRADNLCGTDQSRMVYPTLAKITHEQSAYTLENSFAVRHVDVDVLRYEDRNAPSAVIGRFTL